MSSIASLTSTPANQALNFLNPETPTVTSDTGKQTLNVDDFLKLITVQLTNQDPLKPMEDTQFISQMANFTSLEQMKTLSANFSAFSGAQQIVSAQNLLGRTVTIATEGGNVVGPVTGVKIEGGAPLLLVNGGTFDPADVTNVTTTATSTSANSAN